MTRRSKNWLKPREIARLGLIKNFSESDNVDSNYKFILDLINTGKIKASNYSRGEKKLYLVHKREIDKYNKEWE